MDSQVLSSRFQSDEKNVVSLNDQQQEMVEQVRNKVKSGTYEFESVPCPVCGECDEFRELSLKDRYGLYHPVKICTVCGLIQTNPRMTEDSYAEFYDTEYRMQYHGNENWAENKFDSDFSEARELYAYLEKHLGDISDANILDVGCGPGGWIAHFQERNHRVAGCDLDQQAVQYGQNQGVPVQHCTVDELTLDWEPDIVIMSHIIEHFLSPVADLEEIRNLLHEESKVYVAMPGVKWLDLFRPSYEADFLRQLQNAHTYYFTAKTLENIMNKAGFRSITVNEMIKGIFEPSEVNTDFESDYPEVVEHLERIDRWNRLGVSPLPTVHNLYTHPLVISTLKKLGVHSTAKKVYDKTH